MYLVAILCPALSFLFRGKVLSFILCVILQLTLIGWLPAAAWAVLSLNNAREERRTNRLIREMRRTHRYS